MASENGKIPENIGVFQTSLKCRPSVHASKILIVLPLPSVMSKDWELLPSALRQLLGWGTADPLHDCCHVHLVGDAPSIMKALTVVSRGDAEIFSSHSFSATALALPEKYVLALQKNMPDCSRNALPVGVLRLLAPALLQSLSKLHRQALVLDPAALLMEPPARILNQLWPQGPHDCIGAAAAWPGISHPASSTATASASNMLLPDLAGSIAFNVSCAPRWSRAAQLVLRHSLSRRPVSGRCPRDLMTMAEDFLSAWSPPREAQAQESHQTPVVAGCEWNYQPDVHAGLGHHRLVTVFSEGMSSLYVSCMHTVVHQAFAWQWERDHAKKYPAMRNCGCGMRLRLLMPPRGEAGDLLPLHHLAATAPESLQTVREQLPALFVDGYIPLSMLWEHLATLPEAARRWMRDRTLQGLAPDRVIALIDRRGEDAAGGAATLVLPASPAALPMATLRDLRRSVGTSMESLAPVPVIYPCGWAGAEEDWIPNVLLARCDIEIFCLGALVRDATVGSHARGARAVRPGAVFILQTQQFDHARALSALYDVPITSMILVHISDGNIWQHRVAETAAGYAAWRHAFRQYWVPDDEGSLLRAAESGAVQWIPIGMNPQWVKLMPSLASGTLSRPQASTRAHFLSFLGSTDKSDRAERISKVNAALTSLGVSVFHRNGNVACYGSACTDADYIDLTLSSALCLSLPGSSVESNRLYESLEAGCVPVIIRQFGPGEAAVGTVPEYGPRAAQLVATAFAPLHHVTGSEPPFVVVDHESQLPEALRPLLEDGGRLDALQAQALEWWTMAKRFYSRNLEQAACPAGPWRASKVT